MSFFSSYSARPWRDLLKNFTTPGADVHILQDPRGVTFWAPDAVPGQPTATISNADFDNFFCSAPNQLSLRAKDFTHLTKNSQDNESLEITLNRMDDGPKFKLQTHDFVRVRIGLLHIHPPPRWPDTHFTTYVDANPTLLLRMNTQDWQTVLHSFDDTGPDVIFLSDLNKIAFCDAPFGDHSSGRSTDPGLPRPQ